MGRDTSPLDLFRMELAKLPKNVPTRNMWSSLHYVLTEFKTNLTEMNRIVRGDGNGEKGLLNRVSVLEERTKVIQSDVRETLNMVRALSNEPRKEEYQIPERKWFIEKVLPGLLQTLIISIVAVLVTLIVINIKQIVP